MRLTATIAALACGLAATTASAGPLTLNFHGNVAASEAGLGSFSGSLTWNPTLSRLTVSLTNTTPNANGGLLSGFALQGNPGFTYTAVNLGGWNLFSGPVNGQPYGQFTFGAGTGQNFQGGGGGGIGIGQTINLVFAVGGVANPNSLDAMSFWNANSAGNFGVVRFNSFTNGGSDKVPMALSVVPVPAPALLAGLGLIAGVVVRRRMK